MRKNNTSIYSNKLYSKYGSPYTFMTEASLKKIPKPTIEFLRYSVKGNQHLYKIKITPNRSVNRYDIFVNNNIQINDAIIIKQKIKPSPKVDKEKVSFRRFPKQRESIKVEVDSIKR